MFWEAILYRDLPLSRWQTCGESGHSLEAFTFRVADRGVDCRENAGEEGVDMDELERALTIVKRSVTKPQ